MEIIVDKLYIVLALASDPPSTGLLISASYSVMVTLTIQGCRASNKMIFCLDVC